MDDYSPFTEPGRVRIRGTNPAGVGVLRVRRPSVPVAMTHNFGKSDWDASLFGFFAEGADPAACPECGRTGFFGPRFLEPDLRFRSCRFCGFWQAVDGPPKFLLATVHDCLGWPRISKADYLWWVEPQVDAYQCPFCEDRVDVPLFLVPTPAEDANHPWRQIPQFKSQSVYRRLWNNWKFTSGRTIL